MPDYNSWPEQVARLHEHMGVRKMDCHAALARIARMEKALEAAEAVLKSGITEDDSMPRWLRAEANVALAAIREARKT